MIKKFCALVFLLLVTSSFGNDDCDEDYAIFGCGSNSGSTRKPEAVTPRPTTPRPTTLRPVTARKITTQATDLSDDEEKEAEFSRIEIDANTPCDHDQKCVNFNLCTPDGTINTDGSMLIDERFDGPTQEIVTCPPMTTCCNKKHYVVRRKKEVVCHDKEKISRKCGFRNKDGVAGSVNSYQNKTLYAQFGEFPWQVAIMYKLKTKVVYKGGGSLIHPKVVLTAAHILGGVDTKKVIVRGGEWNTQTTTELCEHQDKSVEDFIVHDDFDRTSLVNDLALIVLNDEFAKSPIVNTVCLAPKDTSYDNLLCYAGGWGQTQFGKLNARQVFLKKFSLPIVPSKKCERELKETPLGNNFELDEKFICAGGKEGVDVCTGDGGSPLVCPIPNNPDYFYQVGIVVGGVNCGSKNVPGFYVDVSKYRSWIDSHIDSLQLDKRSYNY